MDIQITNQDSVTIMALNGMLDSASAPQFQTAVEQLLADGHRKIQLDLSQLVYTSSQGLRIILSLQKGLRQVSGELVIKGMQPAVRDVFTMTGLISLFQIVD